MEKSYKLTQLQKVSDIKRVIENFKKYIGDDEKSLYVSLKYNKKYMVIDNGKYIHFGDIYFPDFTKHQDEQRRRRYLKRATERLKRVGSRPEKYSAQNLAINCLYM